MNAIEKLKQVKLVKFSVMPLNEPNTNRILSESQLTRVNTVIDTKMTPGIQIVLYKLKYQAAR